VEPRSFLQAVDQELSILAKTCVDTKGTMHELLDNLVELGKSVLTFTRRFPRTTRPHLHCFSYTQKAWLTPFPSDASPITTRSIAADYSTVTVNVPANASRAYLSTGIVSNKLQHWHARYGSALHVFDAEELYKDPFQVAQALVNALGLPALSSNNQLRSLASTRCWHDCENQDKVPVHHREVSATLELKLRAFFEPDLRALQKQLKGRLTAALEARSLGALAPKMAQRLCGKRYAGSSSTRLPNWIRAESLWVVRQHLWCLA